VSPVRRYARTLIALLHALVHPTMRGGEEGYTLETVLIVSGLAALAIAVVAGIGVAVQHYLSQIH
jgi:hypothetical protein